MKVLTVGLGFMCAALITFLDFDSGSKAIQVSKLQVATGEGRKLRAAKFDEFVITKDFSIDDAKARVDAFYDHGLKNNLSSVGYVILYRGKCRFSRYTLRATREYLVLQGLSASRIKTVHGGYREEPTMELWVVPHGARPPKPTPTYRSKSHWKC